MLYTQAEIREAALRAYQHSACSDPQYHEDKADQFLIRCVRMHNVKNDMNLPIDLADDENMIDEDVLQEICFAALDANCTGTFWMALAEIEVRGNGCRYVGFDEDVTPS